MLTGATKLLVPREQLAKADALGGDLAAPSASGCSGSRRWPEPSGWSRRPRPGSRPGSRLSPALCLAALMAGAVRTHRRLAESAMPAVVVGVLCVGIAAGRWLMAS
jgi:hypothetical protein